MWDIGQVLGRPVITRSISMWNEPTALFLMETKTKSLLQSVFDFHLTNTSFNFFKLKAFLKYLGWFISTVPLSIPGLLAAVLHFSAIKKFKINTGSRLPCASHLYVAFFFFYITFAVPLKNLLIIFNLFISISAYTHLLSFLSLHTL